MKVKLVANSEHYSDLARELERHGIEIDENAGLVLQETDAFTSCLICKKDNELHRISTEDIIFIESLNHDVLVHTERGVFRAGERLWRLSNLLNPKEFLRISNSVIAARSHIKSIKPALSQKFILTMSDGNRVDVTRTYYYVFRESLGI